MFVMEFYNLYQIQMQQETLHSPLSIKLNLSPTNICRVAQPRGHAGGGENTLAEFSLV